MRFFTGGPACGKKHQRTRVAQPVPGLSPESQDHAVRGLLLFVPAARADDGPDPPQGIEILERVTVDKDEIGPEVRGGTSCHLAEPKRLGGSAARRVVMSRTVPFGMPRCA